MASVLNPVCNKIRDHVIAATDVVTFTVGYRNNSQEEWPYAFLLLDPAETQMDINNTRDVNYAMTIGVYTTSFDATNEILEALLVLWEEAPYRTELTALNAIDVKVINLHPGAMLPDQEASRGFYGEILFNLRVRHTF